MSVFHETMRDILEDVQRFLDCTLECEHLSAASILHKESLLMKLLHLRSEYPQLHLKTPNELNRKSADNTLPYTDMQGYQQSNDYVCSDVPDEDYEVCNYNDSDKDKRKSINITTPIEQTSKNESKSVLKSGFLAKKGKDRLGGLLNTVQRRWVVLKDGQLHFYNKQNDKRCCSSIQLVGYDARFATYSNKDEQRKSACFEIVGPGLKTYQFVAPDYEDAKEWIEIITSCTNTTTSTGDLQRSSSYVQHTSTTYHPKAEDFAGEVYESLEEDRQVVHNNSDSASHSVYVEELYNDTSEAPISDTADALPQQYRDYYLALWDCTSLTFDELSFKRGDLIKILSKEFDEHLWWVGQLNGKIGLLPKQYLTEAYETY